jgi:nucleoside phosphorylase
LINKIKKIGFVTGINSEAKILKSSNAIVFCSNMKPENVAMGTNRLINKGADAIISFGLAGALDPTLKPGSIIIAPQVLTPSYKKIPCNPLLGSKIFNLKKNKRGIYFKPILGSNRPITSQSEKRKVFKESKAAAIDMETHIAAQTARKRKIPFFTIRSICDTADQDLPDIISVATKNKKKLNLFEIFRFVLGKPSELKKFPKLIINYKIGMKSLREILRNFSL